MSRRKNIYPANPYPPGTFLAAHWDARESVRRLAALMAADANRMWRRARKRPGREQ